MFRKAKATFLNIVVAFCIYQALTAGYVQDFSKGAYYLLWMINTINLILMDDMFE